jgi:hypothetical protein
MRKQSLVSEVNLVIDYNNRAYAVLADIRYSIDNDYGADADGNRGIQCTFVEEVLLISVLDIKSGEIMISRNKKTNKLPKDFQQVVESQLEV